MEIFKRKSWVNTVKYGSMVCHGPSGGAYSTTPRLPTAFCAMHMFYAHIILALSAFFFLYYPLTSCISTKGGLTYKRGLWHPLPTMGNKDLVWGVYWGTFPGGGGVRIFDRWRSDSPYFPSRENPVVLHRCRSNIPWLPIFLGGGFHELLYVFIC